jgi:plasmid stabilization system protein ParE
MAASLFLVPEAEQDIADAYAWYESRRFGLGEEFLSCLDACLSSISRAPEMHSLVCEGFRRGLVRRFPFAVFYEYAEATLIVYAVLHTSRDPGTWQQRLA